MLISIILNFYKVNVHSHEWNVFLQINYSVKFLYEGNHIL